MQGHGVSLMDYIEALKNLTCLETSGGNIAEAAAMLVEAATGARARVVAFWEDGKAECSEAIEHKDAAEAFAAELCGRFSEPLGWPELSPLVTGPQLCSIGLCAPVFVPLMDAGAVFGALWYEPPDNRDDERFLLELKPFVGVIAASLRNSRAFRSLQAREYITHSLLDNMDACMCVMELQTDEILFVNSRMYKEYNLTENVTGKKCWQIFERNKPGRCLFCPAYLLEKVPEEPIVWEQLSEVSGKYYKNTNSVIRWLDGRPVHLQYSVDISAEKAVQQGFIEAKQTVDVNKSNFLSRLSHEIRTPLNAIMGMTRIAMSSADLVRAKECIQKIDASSGILLSMVNDVLDISKIESSKMELSHEPFDFEKMVSNVSAPIMAQSDKKRQKLNIRMDESMPRNFTGDETRVAQVMSNLLSNAVKFTPDGGSISMEIDEKTRINNYSVIEVRITDTGIGIPKNRLPMLFTAFAQIDGGTTRKYGGTGLGLAISKSIVKMMNGDIYVESEFGKGSTFIFNIELERDENGAHSALPTGADGPNNQKRHFFAGYRVLIADDDEINRDILIMALEETKLKIECVRNGREVVDKFAENPNAYDLILVDMGMPGLGGAESARIIRGMSSAKAKNIPILAMTSDAVDAGAVKAPETGINDYIAKPVNFEKLFEMLQHYLVEYRAASDRAEDSASAKASSSNPDTFDIDGLADFIDVKDALARVRGNRKIYKTLLQSFANNSGIPELKIEISENKFAMAARTIHSIKGTSANLSLVAVYRFSVLLEGQLKMDYCNESDLASFESDFETTKRYIDKLIPLL